LAWYATILVSLTTARSLKIADFDTPGKVLLLALRGDLRHASAGGAQPFAEVCHGAILKNRTGIGPHLGPRKAQ
jgi:hypothetical protein